MTLVHVTYIQSVMAYFTNPSTSVILPNCVFHQVR